MRDFTILSNSFSIFLRVFIYPNYIVNIENYLHSSICIYIFSFVMNWDWVLILIYLWRIKKWIQILYNLNHFLFSFTLFFWGDLFVGFVLLAHFIFKNVGAFTYIYIYIYEIDPRGRTKYTGIYICFVLESLRLSKCLRQQAWNLRRIRGPSVFSFSSQFRD